MAIMAARSDARHTTTYRTIGFYRPIGQVPAKFIPNLLDSIGRAPEHLPAFVQFRACDRFNLAQAVLRYGMDPIQHGLVDKQRPHHEIGRLQWAAFPDATARAALFAQGFEEHAVDRALHEARLEDHEFTGLSTAGDEVLDKLVEQRDAIAFIGEFVEPEYGVLIEAAGVERLDQRLSNIERDGEVELLGPRRNFVEASADAVNRRAEVQFDQRPEDFVLGLEVMKQRRLPDLHLVCDVTGRGPEVAPLGE
jgi:hypothetical protein